MGLESKSEQDTQEKQAVVMETGEEELIADLSPDYDITEVNNVCSLNLLFT